MYCNFHMEIPREKKDDKEKRKEPLRSEKPHITRFFPPQTSRFSFDLRRDILFSTLRICTSPILHFSASSERKSFRLVSASTA
ncbi:hypothetical protein DTO271G3_8499 [Paecilomyces variotii]|nr:hypothetical protein DTO271G3_8499 [Paecilomyces variotii]